MVADDLAQIGAQLGLEAGKPVMIGLREFDDVVVGRQSAAAGDHGSFVVGLTAQGSGEFDGFDLGSESLGEGAVDNVLQPLLEAIE